MKERYHFSPSEKLVMEALWAKGEPIKQTELLAMFNGQGKDWKRQVLNAFLVRLENRGYVKRERKMVSAVLSKEEMGAYIIGEIAQEYFDGDFNALGQAYEKYQRMRMEMDECEE